MEPEGQSKNLALLQEVGAIITDSHIVYTSDKHGSAYVNKDAVYPHTELTSALCWTIASQFVEYNVEVIVGPALGGIILSQWTADALTKLSGREVLAVYAEKQLSHASAPDPLMRGIFFETGEFIFKRGYDKIVAGKRVLVVEDVLTTGGSVKKVIEAVNELQGEVVGLGALCNRGKVTPADVGFDGKLFAVVEVDLAAWSAEECPLCAGGVPVNTEVGKGREFLARQV